MKIHEIAITLRLQSKEVMEKANQIGIEAKNHMVNLSDEDTNKLVSALKNKGASDKGPKGPTKAKAPAKADPVAQANAAPKKVPKKVDAKGNEEKTIDNVAEMQTEGIEGIASGKKIPKKVSKEILEAEEKEREKRSVDAIKKEDKDSDEEKASAPEVKAEKPAGKKPQLKVAYTDTEELKPVPKAKKAEEKKEEPSETLSEKKKTEKAKKKDSALEVDKKESKKVTKEEEKTETVQEVTVEERSKTKVKAKAKAEGADSNTDETQKGSSKHSANKRQQTQKRDVGTGQKPAKGEEKYGGRNKRNNVRPKRTPVEEAPAPIKRTPILKGGVLEKRPIRSKPRPKVSKNVDDGGIRLEDLEPGTKIINVPITVAGFAEQIERSITDVIMTLMSMGVMANVNQNLDETTIQLLSDELGELVYIGNDEGEIVEEGLELFDDTEEDLVPRPPIITVMGHVDHGKTSLLDAIRKTSVTKGEAGGITQHIGASEVSINGQKIVFLDTPGHEAFTAMRARGAHVTDIAVLVVAADDGVMPQTIESISHARAAGVPIIVAINKIDKEGSNPDRVKQELSDHGILVEEWGGDVISVPVSAKAGTGITNLLEMILLQAEILELKANPKRLAFGTVIEANLDKSRGPVATLLVLNGTLEVGQSIVAGMAHGHIRAMTDFNGKRIRRAKPSTAVEITGLSEVPMGGDGFNAVKEDKIAREIAENRKLRQRDEIMARTSGASLETLFSQISANEMKELNIIIKGDVQGSVGALTASLEKLSNPQVKVNIIHRAVGGITESDVMLANTSNAVIIGFNVRPGAAVLSMAENEGVEIRTYRVIYNAIDDVEAAMKGLLDPEFREVVLGEAEIREIFKVPGIGVIGGAYVTDGKIQRNAEIRLVRDSIVIHEGKISSLKRFKDDAKEVATGFECGIGIENYNDVKQGDIIEAFVMEEIERE